jgi:prepilin-type N-terminal cleavage/methylation domain-containing protein
MPRGHSLPELLVVLAVLAVLAAAGVPRLSAVADRQATARGAERVALAHRRARMLALANARPVTLLLGGDSLVVRWRDGGGTAWRAAGPAVDGASLAPAADSLAYAPNGFAIGAANGGWRVVRGGEAAEVLVSRLGRVRVVRNAN